MKNFIFMIAFCSAAGIAQASETYDCEARIPQGDASLVITYFRNEPSRIDFEFQDRFSKEKFEGILKVNYFDPDGSQLGAAGVVKGTMPEELWVSLDGSLEITSSTGLYYFQLHAWTESNGHRSFADDIDFGYGNLLECQRVL